ncbi:Predicted protein [Taphrina deformans PYCC 5710]|uniref:J domain-containing protein n=1 Tax=Taphrina deformans (strain PYCC 5710 / ATCC 11124 / CBS 356.35 / IMI 108563 / JCM 9778 / NBRC 8474) TaxID=1097556 RepID=R4X7P5_TAPDE|nr:Predicted protein [Taphrina deformans PYCC 5710]|eukprot:CCG81461.1 Predicted protein [Taphrina deformans PYCC 5710]
MSLWSKRSIRSSPINIDRVLPRRIPSSRPSGLRHASSTTHYDTLSVARDATPKEIKEKFYELSKKFHPDVSPESAKKFTEINAAYSVLREASARRDYDRSLPRERGPIGTREGGFRMASGLSRRKTRPMGTPPSSPFRASASPASNRPAGFDFGANPAPEGEVRNARFTYDEHRERHSAFDSRYNIKLEEELSRRNAELKDNFMARFLGIAGLIAVVILLTGGISSIRAEVHGEPSGDRAQEVTWSEVMKARRRAHEHSFWQSKSN